MNWRELTRKQLGDHADTLGIKLNKRTNLRTMQSDFESQYNVEDHLATSQKTAIEEPQQVDAFVEVALSELNIKDTFYLNGECRLDKKVGIKAYWYNLEAKIDYTGSSFRIVEVKQ